MRTNMLKAIQEVEPAQAEMLQNAPVMQLQNFINQYNAKITGEPIPPVMNKGMPHTMSAAPGNPNMMNAARPAMVRLNTQS